MLRTGCLTLASILLGSRFLSTVGGQDDVISAQKGLCRVMLLVSNSYRAGVLTSDSILELQNISAEFLLHFWAGGLFFAVVDLLGLSHSCAFSITGRWFSWSGDRGRQPTRVRWFQPMWTCFPPPSPSPQLDAVLIYPTSHLVILR